MTAVSTTKKKSKDGGFVEFVKVIFHAILIAVVVRTLLFQPFNIPSGSLIPTLLIGDYLFVSKFSYGYSRFSIPYSPNLFSGRIWAAEPQRGEIAVFKLPKDNATDYIKRVIGLPGDRIQMIDGILHINGEMVKREPAGFMKSVDNFGRATDVPLYRETLPGGVTHIIAEKDGDDGYYDNTFEYVVPPGHFFMMGDNRDNSTDSRDLNSVGYVPFENFVGKAQIIFFSVEEGSSPLAFWEWPWTVRWDRLFQMVR
jgi:signal peptidase I